MGMHDESNYVSELFDIVSFWSVNFTSAFLLSAAHNVLIFVLDWRTSILHFLHFACTFAFLIFKHCGSRFVGKSSHGDDLESGLPVVSATSFRSALSVIYPAIVSQVFVSLLSAEVHSQNRAGELYLLRIFDFLSTMVALKTKFTLSNEEMDKRQYEQIWKLLIPVALAGSLSWVEFGHIEFDRWSLLLAPVLAVVQGVHIVLVRNACVSFEQLSERGGLTDHSSLFEQFALIYTGAVTMILALPASISFSSSVISYDASWESIDYVLIGMSVVFMASYKYSELWLQTHLKLHHYCALEHTKYFMGSCGQWFLQNMAHASVYAACGKLLFLAAILRYWSGFDVLTPAPRKQSDA